MLPFGASFGRRVSLLIARPVLADLITTPTTSPVRHGVQSAHRIAHHQGLLLDLERAFVHVRYASFFSGGIMRCGD